MSPIAPISTIIAAPAVPAIASSGSGEFQNLLTSSIRRVEELGAQSSNAVQQFLSGDTDDLHKAAMLTQRAELSTELFLQVRNKVVQAYQEIMRMQM